MLIGPCDYSGYLKFGSVSPFFILSQNLRIGCISWMRELLIEFDDCFLSFVKRKTLLSEHKNNFRFSSKVLLKCRKGHFRTQNVSATPWPVKAYDHAHLSGGFAPSHPTFKHVPPPLVAGTKFCPRDKISHGAYDGICPCNMSRATRPAICRLVCPNF